MQYRHKKDAAQEKNTPCGIPASITFRSLQSATHQVSKSFHELSI